MKLVLALWSVGCVASARAHDGHGLTGAHWHASDAFGYAVLGLAVMLAVWAARRK